MKARTTEHQRGPRRGWIDASHLLGEGFVLVFTDRTGGVSPAPFDTLNLAFHTGDDPGNVDSNRMLVAKALGIETGRTVYLRQVHGVRVAGVDHTAAAGTEAGGCMTLDDTDGVFTSLPGLALAVLTADCVPLALAAPSRGVVAMLHAGWRGTIDDIARTAIDRMRNELGLDRDDLRAVMGPAIGPCCYEVDEGRADIFVEKYGDESGVVVENGGYRLDLRKANTLNLLQAGLRARDINEVGGCTYCEQRYFSFRREGTTGRQGAFIFLGESRERDGTGWKPGHMFT